MMKTAYFFYSTSLFLLSIITSCGTRTGSEQTMDTVVDSSAYLDQGLSITQQTFQTLSGKLKSVLEREGVPGALQYCNLAAYPLTDSLSRLHDVTIRRASHRSRNPANQANAAEMEIIRKYQELKEKGEIPAPLVQKEEGKIHYYSPIILTENCLACHGQKNTDISEENYTLISQLYPRDQAYGFQTGELRGIWNLEFK